MINVMFSEKYLSVYFTFILLMIGFSLKFLEHTLGYSLIAIGDPDKPLIVNIVRAVISLVGNLWLLPLVGFVGAAIVSVLSNVVAIPLDALFLMRRRLLPQLMEYIKPLLVFGALSLLFLVPSQPSYIIKGVIVLIYFPVCFLISTITANDFRLLYNESRSTVSRFFGQWAAKP